MTIDSEDDTAPNVIRIGGDYQATVPLLATVKVKPAPEGAPEKAVLVWSPTSGIREDDCEFGFDI